MTPAVPDPTVEALATMSRGEGVEFYAKVLDAAGFPLAAVIVRDAAARAAAPDALRVRVAALESALRRTETNFIAAINGRPVRDMAENLAENRAALLED